MSESNGLPDFKRFVQERLFEALEDMRDEAIVTRKFKNARRDKQTIRQAEDEGLIDLAEHLKQQPLALPALPAPKKRGRPPGSKTRPTIAQVKAAENHIDAQDAELEEEEEHGPTT